MDGKDAQKGLAHEITRDVSKNDLLKIKETASKLKKDPELQKQAQILFDLIACDLVERFGPNTTVDSISDQALNNYLYLVLSSNGVEQYRPKIKEEPCVDCEEVLFTAMECGDQEGVLNIIRTYPDLLNVKITNFWAKKPIQQVLQERGFVFDYENLKNELHLEGRKEPEPPCDFLSFEKVKMIMNGIAQPQNNPQSNTPSPQNAQANNPPPPQNSQQNTPPQNPQDQKNSQQNPPQN